MRVYHTTAIVLIMRESGVTIGEDQNSRKSGQWRTRTSEASLGASDLQSGALATLPTVHYINVDIDRITSYLLSVNH